MYYRLTYKNSWQGHKVGENILCSKRPLDIGQTTTCDVILPESDRYEPRLFATILPLESGGWCIVRRTDFFDILVNGEPLKSASKLENGDIICFSGFNSEFKIQNTLFSFTIHTDSDYDDAAGVIYRHPTQKRTAIVTTVLTVLALIVACIAIFGNRHSGGLKEMALDNYDASVYHIMADSVLLVMDTIIDGVDGEVVVDRVALTAPQSATCFLTDEGLFVTARHCIEPWIADETWDGISEMTMPAEVRLAAIAETANRTGESQWHVKAHCIVSRNGENYDFMSDDFYTDRSRDLVMQLGTPEHPLWFRTIVPVATRRDMELGDFAYIKAPEGLKGTFTLATREDLQKFDQQSNREIAILGYPVKDNDDGDAVTHLFGNSQHIFFDSTASRMRGCIQMSAQVNPGNSGGPILACIDGKIKVIGIVSKSDMHASQGTFWAVPTTELTRKPFNLQTIQPSNPQTTYRR